MRGQGEAAAGAPRRARERREHGVSSLGNSGFWHETRLERPSLLLSPGAWSLPPVQFHSLGPVFFPSQRCTISASSVVGRGGQSAPPPLPCPAGGLGQLVQLSGGRLLDYSKAVLPAVVSEEQDSPCLASLSSTMS